VAFGISIAGRELVLPVAEKWSALKKEVQEDLTAYPIARIPLIVPVSYPKRTPPKATNMPVGSHSQ
jgi:hypothetical protein